MVFNGVPYKTVCTRNRPKVQFALTDSGTTNPTSAADTKARRLHYNR